MWQVMPDGRFDGARALRGAPGPDGRGLRSPQPQLDGANGAHSPKLAGANGAHSPNSTGLTEPTAPTRRVPRVVRRTDRVAARPPLAPAGSVQLSVAAERPLSDSPPAFRVPSQR